MGDAVRQVLIARQLEEQITARFPVGRRLRVLDVALGSGSQALWLARVGHQVTGLESDPVRLKEVAAALDDEPAGIRERVRVITGGSRETGAHFLPGSFDVVLCHGVLSEMAEPGPMLAGLGRVLAQGGLLSLVVRNVEATAMRPARNGDWYTTLAAMDPMDPTDRALRREALAASLTGIGAPLYHWYGIQVFSGDETVPAGDRERELLLAAEERAGCSDPYRAVASLLHLCGVRG